MPMHLMMQLEMSGFLAKAEYIFEFEGVQFRLVRGTDKELDKLSTITDGSDKAGERVYETALRLCDYLSLQWGIGIRCSDVSGSGFDAGKFTLDNIPITFFHSRGLRSAGIDLTHLPEVKTEQGRLALSLLNEAEGSNSPFFSFINYWKILEIPPSGKTSKGSPEDRAIAWIDHVPGNKVYFSGEFRERLKSRGVTLTAGNYLWSKCRNAIAHITRPPTLTPSKVRDRQKILEATRVLEALALFYIETVLGVHKYAAPIKILKAKKRTKALKFLKHIRKPISRLKRE